MSLNVLNKQYKKRSSKSNINTNKTENEALEYSKMQTIDLRNEYIPRVLDLIYASRETSKVIKDNRKKIINLLKINEEIVSKMKESLNFLLKEMPSNALEAKNIDELARNKALFGEYLLSLSPGTYKDDGYFLLLCYYFYITDMFLGIK